jgi:hypothetical protein
MVLEYQEYFKFIEWIIIGLIIKGIAIWTACITQEFKEANCIYFEHQSVVIAVKESTI